MGVLGMIRFMQAVVMTSSLALILIAVIPDREKVIL
jgi:hypothetical protein